MSVGATMSLADLKDYLRAIRTRVAGADGAIVRGIHAGVLRSVATVQTATDYAPPASDNGAYGAVNTGAYKGGWKWTLSPNGGRLYNARGYAANIEYGRLRGSAQPPLKAIERWARRRLGLSPAEARRARYPIAAAIKRRGLKPRRVLTSDGSKREIVQNVLEEVNREVAAFLASRGRTP